jgi:phosphohistidine phosphatase
MLSKRIVFIQWTKMKRLYIVRHAKSDRSDPSLTDYARWLNKRWNKDLDWFLPIIAEKLALVDKIVTSWAKRTLLTSLALIDSINYRTDMLTVSDILYEAWITSIMDIIKSTENNINWLMIVWHNPWLTEFVNVCGFTISNIPTSGIVCFEYKLNDWGLFTTNQNDFLWYEYPKKYK